MGMMILNGSHGTSKKNAASIAKEGFNFSFYGDLGKGAYFWGDEEYLKELGEAWAKYRLSQGSYRVDESLVVLFVEIRTYEERFFDYNRDIKRLVIKEMNRCHMDTSNDEECSKFVDMVIQKVEKEIGVDIQVLKGEIGPPPRKYFGRSFPYSMMTTATCYVVKDVNTIKVKDIENILV